ncbi:hypothetical protein J6590_092771 [Homalodisca vitripennis]|nr:hypothetical protein J6590_092771 [Homalodisca vitripennis]
MKSANPLEFQADEVEKDFVNISGNHGKLELNKEIIGYVDKLSEKCMETLEEDPKISSENRIEDKSGSELKLEKDTSDGKIKIHEDKLKEKCDNKTRAVVSYNKK